MCSRADHTDGSRAYAYSTDLVPWYPGKHPSGKGDLKPTPEEVELCWEFFERECALVEPRAIVLLGKWAADRYLRRYGSEPLGGSLTDAIGRRFDSEVAGRRMVAVAAYHPSAVWGKFEEVGARSWSTAVDQLRPVLGP